MLLCIDFEQEMCGKHPTRFASPDGGSDPIVSESTDGPIRTQCIHNPIWSGLTNGKGVEDKKDTTNQEIYKQFYLQLISEYPLSDFFLSFLFTDGSKTEEGVAAAAVSTKRINKPFTCRLPDDSSVYTAELRAIQFSSQTCLLF